MAPYMVKGHYRVPEVTCLLIGRIIQPDLLFKKVSYQPRPLLQRTLEFIAPNKSFDEWRSTVKEDFMKRFINAQIQSYPDETQLRSLMQALDTFFFSNLLTEGPDPIVKLEFRDDIFSQIGKLGEGQQELLGNATLEWAPGQSRSALRVTIRVDATQAWPVEERNVRRDLIDVLETLVHEMAHAYLIVFVCRCDECLREMGAKGHGPVFRELKQAMYMEMRRWDVSLRNFYIDDYDSLD